MQKSDKEFSHALSLFLDIFPSIKELSNLISTRFGRFVYLEFVRFYSMKIQKKKIFISFDVSNVEIGLKRLSSRFSYPLNGLLRRL